MDRAVMRVLRLLVKDVDIGPEKIAIRHRVPARHDSAATRIPPRAAHGNLTAGIAVSPR